MHANANNATNDQNSSMLVLGLPAPDGAGLSALAGWFCTGDTGGLQSFLTKRDTNSHMICTCS